MRKSTDVRNIYARTCFLCLVANCPRALSAADNVEALGQRLQALLNIDVLGFSYLVAIQTVDDCVAIDGVATNELDAVWFLCLDGI